MPGLQSDGSPGGMLFDQLSLAGAINTDFSRPAASPSNSNPMASGSPHEMAKASPEGGYNFQSIVDSCAEEQLETEEAYPDSGYPSPPPTTRNSQNLSTIDEDDRAFRQRAWSANSMLSSRTSLHWPKFEVGGYNSPQSPVSARSPDSAFHNYGRFSFDEESINRVGSEEDIMSQGMTGVAANGPLPPVWCLCCSDQLVVVGCRNGRIEVSSETSIIPFIRSKKLSNENIANT